MTDRYSTDGNHEGEYQPGSDNKVLRNQLGITDVDEMEGLEFDALLQLELALLDELAMDSRITTADLCHWHERWLGEIYSWAGSYRTVNMSKDGFIFAAAHLIPKLMADFEKKFLAVHTPCQNMTQEQVAEAIAICHVEFIIVHPFREGNGRLGRLLATIMGLQADMPLLDFRLLEEEKQRYIMAIHAGHAGDYKPMTVIFSEVLSLSHQESDQ